MPARSPSVGRTGAADCSRGRVSGRSVPFRWPEVRNMVVNDLPVASSLLEHQRNRLSILQGAVPIDQAIDRIEFTLPLSRGGRRHEDAQSAHERQEPCHVQSLHWWSESATVKDPTGTGTAELPARLYG